MATAVQIQIVLDEKGVVRGVQNINDGIKKIGQQGNVVFTEFNKRQKDAREAAEALAYGLGVNIPLAVQKALVKIPGLAAGLASLGRVAGIGALVLGFEAAIVNLDQLKTKILDVASINAQFWQSFYNFASGKGFGGQLKAISDIRAVSDAIAPLGNQFVDLENKARSAGLQGIAAIEEQTRQATEAVKIGKEQFLQQQRSKYEADSDIYQRIETAAGALTAASLIKIEQAKQRQILQLRRQTAEQTRQLESQATGVGLTGASSILHDEADALRKIDEQQKESVITAQDADRQRAALHQIALGKIFQEEHDFTEQMNTVIATSVASSATGIEQIAEQTKNKIADLVIEFNKEFAGLDVNDPTRKAAQTAINNAIGALNQARDTQIRRQQQDATEQTIELEEKAAAASVAPWNRANAQIVNDYNQSMREIQRLLNDHEISEEDAQRRRAAIWQDANAQILDANRQLRDELAGELESVFDDITSGNIGRRILQEVKHFFAQIVAQWILSLNQIRGASAGSSGGIGGGGGILGGVLGSIFGIPGGGGIATTPPFSPGGGGSATPFNIFGAFGGSGLPALGATISAGAGTAGAVKQQAANTVLGGIVQAGLGKIFSHGLGPFSGVGLGVLGGTIGISSILSAYGSGSPVKGALGGALGGALLGTSILPGIGTLIGAGIGAIAGFFSGIFGRRSRERKAWALVDQKYQPAIVEIYKEYKSFQLDYQTAIDDLQQLQGQAQQELAQFGKTGDYIFRKAPGASIIYRVENAKKLIDGIEGKRQQLAGVSFAPPQFAIGGTVPGIGPRLIIAHGGEEIIRQPAASQNRNLLKSINSGNVSNGGETHVHFHVNAIDAQSVVSFFKSNARMIRQAVRQDKLNYAGGSDF